MQDDNDPVQKIFGKSIKQLFKDRQDSKADWRVGHLTHRREILSKMFLVTKISNAVTMAALVVQITEAAGYHPGNLQLSISSRDLLIVLHSGSNGAIDEKGHKLAKLIDTALQSQGLIAPKPPL